MKEKIVDLAYAKATEVLKACVRPKGFHASALEGGYEALWSRDSMKSALGAALLGDEFKAVIKASLETLAKHQTELGLIPNCVGSYNTERQSDVTFNSIDAPQWYIIGHYVYAKAYGDGTLLKKYRKSILNAFSWLRHQDPNNDNLIVQQPTADWMDAFPHKYGRVLHTQALQYGLLKMMGQDELAEKVKNTVNGVEPKYLALYDKNLGYYLPWAWKDHGGDREQEEFFDSAANCLAIVTGLATPQIAKRIISYIEKEKVNLPFGCKNIWPPIKPGSAAWKPYFNNCDARTPLSYINGGIWPWIGGMYVAALVKVGEFKKAEKELERLAQGNMQVLKIRDLDKGYEFNEWLDGKTGKPKGEPFQAWSAGLYLYAYECVKQKKVLYFD